MHASAPPRVDVIATFDTGYAPHFAALLASLAACASPDRDYAIHAISDVTAPDMIASLESCLKDRPRMRLNVVPRSYAGATARERFVSTTSVRLELGRLFPALRRAVYLDVDMVAMRDVGDLYDVDLAGRTIGAVRDVAAYRMYRAEQALPEPGMHAFARDFRDYLDRHVGLPPEAAANYFNSGALVLDLDRWRAIDVDARIRARAPRPLADYHYCDQDVLNLALHDDVTFLDPRWNYFAWWQNYILAPDFPIEPGPPFILHYAGPKPWDRHDVPHADRYFAALAETPFAGQVLRAEPPRPVG